MRLILFFCLFGFVSCLVSQNLSNADFSYLNRPTSFTKTLLIDDTAYVLGFTTTAPSAGFRAALIMLKIDNKGNLCKTIFHDLDSMKGFEYFVSNALVDHAKNIVIIADGQGTSKTFYSKIDRNGNLIRQVSYENPGLDSRYTSYVDIFQYKDSSYIVNARSGLLGGSKAKCLRLSKNGDTTLSKTENIFVDEVPVGSTMLRSNLMLSNTSEGRIDCDFTKSEIYSYFLKWNNQCQLVSRLRYPRKLAVVKTFELENSDYLCYGRYHNGTYCQNNAVYPLYTGYIARIDSGLIQPKWELKLGYTSTVPSLFSVLKLQDNNFLGIGTTYDTSSKYINEGIHRGWLVKFTENGDTLWTRKDFRTLPDGRLNNTFNGAVQFSNGNILAYGFIEDGLRDTIQSQRGWTKMYGNNGEEKSSIINTAWLNKIAVYPNPFFETLNIEFESSMGKSCLARIYDFSGKLLHQETIASGQVNSLKLQGTMRQQFILEIRTMEGAVIYNTKLVRD
jgi:hypothetical protein